MTVITKDLPVNGIWSPVLDSGYVRIPEDNGRPLVLGSDLNTVNAARCSFLKESIEFSESDEKLLRFLWNRKETEPFRHNFMTFEIKAPLMVCRQHWRYAVGSNYSEYTTSWSEASRRYITMEPEFYIPEFQEWRAASKDKKQGSGDPVIEPIGKYFTDQLISMTEYGIAKYEEALHEGICAEQARLFLPANGMYTIYRWSCSLGSLLHFLAERLEDKAQYEIREYALAIKQLIEPFFPITMKAAFE